MPRILLQKGVAPWVTDRATWPLLAIIGGAGVYVGYTMGKHLLLNPEVQVSRTFRGRAAAEGKFDSELGHNWYRGHQLQYRHKDWDVSRMSLFETLKPGYWSARAQVARDPEAFTASGAAALK